MLFVANFFLFFFTWIGTRKLPISEITDAEIAGMSTVVTSASVGMPVTSAGHRLQQGWVWVAGGATAQSLSNLSTRLSGHVLSWPLVVTPTVPLLVSFPGPPGLMSMGSI